MKYILSILILLSLSSISLAWSLFGKSDLENCADENIITDIEYYESFPESSRNWNLERCETFQDQCINDSDFYEKHPVMCDIQVEKDCLIHALKNAELGFAGFCEKIVNNKHCLGHVDSCTNERGLIDSECMSKKIIIWRYENIDLQKEFIKSSLRKKMEDYDYRQEFENCEIEKQRFPETFDARWN